MKVVRSAQKNARAGLAVRDRVLALLETDPFRSRRRTVSGYWPVGAELDSRPLLTALAARGWQCALPVVSGPEAPLRFRCWRPGDRLAISGLGLHEPLAAAPEIVPAIVIAPMLAVDGDGRRLGHGGGYYDRTIRTFRARGAVTAVAIGYDRQIVPAVPSVGDDEPVDWVVSEARVLRCPSERGGGRCAS